MRPAELKLLPLIKPTNKEVLMMSQQVKTWLKDVSGMEHIDTADAERLVVRQESDKNVTFEFWDYEGKRGEMAVPAKVATVLARSIMLCIEGSLDQIGVNL